MPTQTSVKYAISSIISIIQIKKFLIENGEENIHNHHITFQNQLIIFPNSSVISFPNIRKKQKAEQKMEIKRYSANKKNDIISIIDFELSKKRTELSKCQKNRRVVLLKNTSTSFDRILPRIRRELTLLFIPHFIPLPRSNTNFTDTGRIEEGKSSCKILHQGKRVPLFPFLRCNGHRSCYSWSGILLWDEKAGETMKNLPLYSTVYYIGGSRDNSVNSCVTQRNRRWRVREYLYNVSTFVNGGALRPRNNNNVGARWYFRESGIFRWIDRDLNVESSLRYYR